MDDLALRYPCPNHTSSLSKLAMLAQTFPNMVRFTRRRRHLHRLLNLHDEQYSPRSLVDRFYVQKSASAMQ